MTADPIADVFPELTDLVKGIAKKGIFTLSPLMDFSSSDDISQTELFFIHDLIYLCGPLESKFLFEILEYLFPQNKHFQKVHHILPLLEACCMVKRVGNNFSSTRDKLFLLYLRGFPKARFISAFRVFNLLS